MAVIVGFIPVLIHLTSACSVETPFNAHIYALIYKHHSPFPTLVAPFPLTFYLPFQFLKYKRTYMYIYVFVIVLVSAAVPITAEFFRAPCVKYFVVYAKAVVVTHASAAPFWWGCSSCCCYLFLFNNVFFGCF